ncbi:unnamed protein product [Darwinula stevensoni]|uniref:LRAT domain-containing protein n=1 Tax=Darwinula stevensoni TaxID=69355 RepID=A0A7R8X9J7_9CRUS|nr:unnamed protein product [Darwinula stevensoni]CAG0885633.1 unnamed protein product [Darwinula stevensoni]
MNEIPFYGKDELPILKSMLQCGDLLEFERKDSVIPYGHYAVFVGEVPGTFLQYLRHVCPECKQAAGSSPCACHILYVIHRSSSGTGLLAASSKSRSIAKGRNNIGNVMLDSLDDIFESSRVRINNFMDHIWTPFPTDVILQNALDAFLKDRRSTDLQLPYNEEYNILRNNCEHFATLCRYGKKKSKQVENTGMVVSAAVILSTIINMGWTPYQGFLAGMMVVTGSINTLSTK